VEITKNPITQKEIESIFNEVDKNKNGFIDYSGKINL
jgi:Ca2+-binding EF-hand superfamily protein